MADRIERTTALIAWRPAHNPALPIPGMGRFTETGGLLLARVAPFQALAMRKGLDVPLLDELAPLVPGASLIDLSDARIGVRIHGSTRLAHLVPLDLHPARFAPGHCAQTIMAHMSVLLLQTGPEEYEIQGARSYMASFLRAFETV